MTTKIHIDWRCSGCPFPYKEKNIHADCQCSNRPSSAEEFGRMNNTWDYGLYQIYGYHPVYGADTLLYIGMTQNEKSKSVTFADKMKEHDVHLSRYATSDSIAVYFGRLIDAKTSDTQHGQIKQAEKLLIYAHNPAWNFDIEKLDFCIYQNDEFFNLHIFNWGRHKRLLPEVSGRRYARRYPSPGEYKIYGKDS